ncbi:FkbM family methyltransferase [Poriferisphaera sp. WC338]|uniref:FkbM family methyltransferase n=1 Tax=Poriferisphaera sp. WC338 TaxID=3425129 RepID=UPI003D8152BC
MSLAMLAPVILPITRHDLPGADHLYSLIVGQGCSKEERWQKAGTRWATGKHHGYLMQLNLSDWMDRYTYFYGQFYEVGVQLLFQKLVREGDHILDVGANTGMLSLLASKLVGEQGVVQSVEPNNDCCKRIEKQIAKNKIKNIQLHHIALADSEGEATLKIVPRHSGFSTLSELNDDTPHEYAETENIQTITGDCLLSSPTAQAAIPVSLIKMDIEGFEVNALHGLGRTLVKDKPAVVTEVNPYCLQRAGTDAGELFALMHSHGYEGYLIDTHHKRWAKPQLLLTPISQFSGEETHDVLWLHEDDAVNKSLTASCFQ